MRRLPGFADCAPEGTFRTWLSADRTRTPRIRAIPSQPFASRIPMSIRGPTRSRSEKLQRRLGRRPSFLVPRAR
jgi:hypothetical protein